MSIAVLSTMALGNTLALAETSRWKEVSTEIVQEINSDIQLEKLTADVGVYYPSNLDRTFTEKFSVSDLLEEFRKAKKIFAVAGVQLNLLWVRTGEIDPAYFEIQSNDIAGMTPSGKYANMYVDSRRKGTGLSAEALEAFESIVEVQPGNERTVYLVVLQDVFMSFYEQMDERTWEIRTITTGGLSFPSYSYTGMPNRLRGVITVNKSDPKRGLVAHELGHKLLNVSHEYREVDPQHEVRADGGLMLYGTGTEIASGRDGRWHQERLLLSPYLYKQSSDGVRTWNPDYQEGGHYYDPIYGDFVVEFGVREWAKATE